jgi:hypothetical protein
MRRTRALTVVGCLIVAGCGSSAKVTVSTAAPSSSTSSLPAGTVTLPTVPASTTTTAAATTTTAAATTTTAAPKGPDPTLAALADSEGLVHILSSGKHLVVERDAGTESLVAAIITDKGTVVPIDDPVFAGLARFAGQAGDLVGFAAGYAMNDTANRAAAKVYDVATGKWTDVPIPKGDFGSLQPIAAGDHLIVGETLFGPGGTAAPMSKPADAAAFPTAGTMNLWTGKELIVAQADSAAGVIPDLAKPWAYDPAKNTWRALPAPPWCGATCVFAMIHEGGDTEFATATDKELVVSEPAPLGNAVLELATGAWRKLPAAPVPTETPAALPTAKGVVVIPQGDVQGKGALGKQLVLDPTTGTWKVDPLPFAIPEGQQLLFSGDDATLCVVTDPDGNGKAPTLAGVMDATSGEWRTITEADRASCARSVPLWIPVAQLEKP